MGIIICAKERIRNLERENKKLQQEKQELEDALVELGELYAEQDDALVELAEMIVGEG